jgi:hypothetical protein
MVGHVETPSGGCDRPGCQTVGLDVDLETAALALIFEFAETDSLEAVTADDLVLRARAFLAGHGLAV